MLSKTASGLTSIAPLISPLTRHTAQNCNKSMASLYVRPNAHSHEVFARRMDKDYIMLVTPDQGRVTLSSAQISQVNWIEPFSWLVKIGRFDALRGLILFHLYSHQHLY